MSTATRSPLVELRALRTAAADADTSSRAVELLNQIDDAYDLATAGGVVRDHRLHERLAAAGTLPPERVALLGSSTLDPLPDLLVAALARCGLLGEVREAPYGQWRLELMAGAPSFAGWTPGLVVLLLDDRVVFDEVTDPTDLDEVASRCAAVPAEVANWVASSQELLGGRTVLTTLPLRPLRRDTLVDYAGKAQLDAAWLRMNAGLLDLANEPQVTVLGDTGLSARATVSPFVADRMRLFAQQAYAPEYLWCLADEVARLARAERGGARKCLVLDLDDTLWGGVVGEDGLDGLRLGDAYPGSAFGELQALARDLSSQGVLLAVASKNDDAVARKAIAEHPDMVLRPEDFAAVEANWGPKPDSVRALARQLNIGTDAMAFLDDSPAERELMRRELPEVATIERPSEPAAVAAHVAACGLFNLVALTDEDRARRDLYRTQEARADSQAAATDLASYLHSLDSRLTVEPLGPLNRVRIAQLFARTNQFNLTGVRYGEAELVRFCESGGAVHAVRLADRFGDNGLVAALALQALPSGDWEITSFVLSCRVFSRGVEEALVALLLRDAAEAGAAGVVGRFVPTKKNQRFAGFYPDLGFRPLGEASASDAQVFRHDLIDLPGLPAWLSVDDRSEVFHVRR